MLKNRVFVAITILLFCFLNSQSKKNNDSGFDCYLPTGLKCNIDLKGITVGQINRKFENKGRVWSAYLSEEKVDISFKAFTMEPLFILPLNNQKLSSDKIIELINKVNDDNTSFHYYFGTTSWGGHHLGLKSDIDRFIKKGILDQEFLVNSIGNPDEIKTSIYEGKEAVCYKYNNIGVRIYLVDDNAVGFEEF